MIHVLEKLHVPRQHRAVTDQFHPPVCITALVLYNEFKKKNSMKCRQHSVGMYTHVSQTNT